MTWVGGGRKSRPTPLVRVWLLAGEARCPALWSQIVVGCCPRQVVNRLCLSLVDANLNGLCDVLDILPPVCWPRSARVSQSEDQSGGHSLPHRGSGL